MLVSTLQHNNITSSKGTAKMALKIVRGIKNFPNILINMIIGKDEKMFYP